MLNELLVHKTAAIQKAYSWFNLCTYGILVKNISSLPIDYTNDCIKIKLRNYHFKVL